MIRIQLPKGVWQYDPTSPLGDPGGFGAVFKGQSAHGDPVAIKRLHLSAKDAAHRELRMADLIGDQRPDHVVPILDSGQDADSGDYFLVMPVADSTLSAEVEHRGQIPEQEAVPILRQIADGLAACEGIVHRDLKPQNVLRHDGHWKLADFGIAKFAEESTSLRTLRDCLSPYYAAPEQWNQESATAATDVYALGCIAVTLLLGRPPFEGADRAEIRRAHLTQEPPPLGTVDPRLRSLIQMMMRKAPPARPTIERVRVILNGILDTPSAEPGGLDALREAGARASRRAAEEEATQNELEERIRARRVLRDEGVRILDDCMKTIRERLEAQAPNLTVFESAERVHFQLGSSELVVDLRDTASPVPEDAFPRSRWNVVTMATVVVRQRDPAAREHSASLYYASRDDGQSFRWWEIRFESHPLMHQQRPGPFAVNNCQEADAALGPGMHTIQLAEHPRTMDDENLEDTCTRWAGWLAEAQAGRSR